MKLAHILVVAFLAIMVVPITKAHTLQLDYSTYLGGSSGDRGYDIKLDSLNRIYLTGYTDSSDFPTLNPYQAYLHTGADIFVSCLSSSGSILVYSTYIGGTATDNAYGIAIDSMSRTYIAGFTDSSNFPTVNAYQGRCNLSDAVVFCLSSSGSSLAYSTYLGGTGSDQGNAIALDTLNRAYLTGNTMSADFPTISAFQSSLGPDIDAFVSCLSSSGSILVYSSYLGGTGHEEGNDIGLDALCRAYVTGTTKCLDFPTENPYQAALRGIDDIFISCLVSSGSTLLYSTYLGGSYDQAGYGLVIDSLCRAFLTGYTTSYDFPTVNAYQASRRSGTSTAIVSCLSSSGSELIYSTYLGGEQTDAQGYDITLDPFGRTWLIGDTLSSDFPIFQPYQSSNAGGRDIFISCLSSSGSNLYLSTYLGGDANDFGRSIALESPKCAYIAGYTASSNFPIKQAYQFNIGGGTDAFISRINCIISSAGIDSGDYNGDGTADVAIFRGSAGFWAAKNLTRAYFGNQDDTLVAADYNGDGTTDIAIFRPVSALWAVRDITRVYFGASNDALVPGDYDGNGTCKVGVFRASSGLWSIGNLTRVYFGMVGDIPIPGDYSGDGRKDIGVFRGESGLWAIRNVTRVNFGVSTDHLVPGDYNGAGEWEGAIFRPSSGLWSIRNVTRFYLGSATDWSLPGDYDGNGRDEAGIFRDSTGMWSIRDLTRVYFGSTNDIPVTR